MYRKNKIHETTIIVNQRTEGETIEQKIERITNNKEPITDGAPLIYTEREDGVQPEYDVRTDRFEVAVEAMDKVQKTKLAQRQERLDKKAETAKVVEMPKKDNNANESQAQNSAEPKP